MRKSMIVLAMTVALGVQGALTGYAANLPSTVAPNGVGIDIHFTGAPSQDLNLIQSSGAKFIRMDMTWSSIETKAGVYNWAAYDQLLAGLTARGIRPIFELDFNNPALYGGTWVGGLTTQAQVTAYTKFCAAAAARYKGQGIIWEIWNEPNLTQFWGPAANVNQYMAMALQAIPAIRAADSNATIIAPATATITGDVLDFSFLTTCFQQGLLPLVDAVSVHTYRQASPENVKANMQQLQTLIKQYSPNKALPIVVTEMGYSTTWAATATDQTQANYLARTFLTNMSLGIPLTIWYDFKDDGTDSTNFQNRFGILTTSYSPKLAYTSMQKLTQALSGKTFVKNLSTTSGDYLLQFSDGTNTTVAAWTTGSTHNVTINGSSVSISGSPVYVNGGTATTPPVTTAPAAPTNLKVGSITKGATTGGYYINLAWTDNATTETGVQVQQAVNSTTNFSTVATLAAKTTSYSTSIGTSPTNGSTYYYRVISANGTVLSSPSNMTTTQVVIPSAPSNLVVTQTKNATTGHYMANLTWANTSTNGTGINVLKSSSATTGYATVSTVAATATNASIDLGTTPGTYYFQVDATSTFGQSASSNTVNTTIASTVATPPAAPTNLSLVNITKGATTGAYYANLTWTDNATTETGVQVQQAVNSTTNFSTIATLAPKTSSYSASLGTAPTAGNYYYYRTISANGSVLSNPSNSVVTQVGIPNAPTNLVTSVAKNSAGHNIVTLTWVNHSGIAAGFNILQSASATTGFSTVKTVAASPTSTTVDLGTTSGTRYFQVAAFSTFGQSASANTCTVKI